MLSQHEIMQTIQMIDQQHLDVRTITMGISLLSCARSDPKAACDAIYDKITRYAEKLVATGEAIEAEFGIPIVNKRISVTPIALVAAAAWTPPSVLWTSPWPPPRRWATVWPGSWRKWVWRCAAPMAPPRPWPCSTMR